MGVVTVPTGEVLAVEQRGEAGGRGIREERGSGDGEERGEETHGLKEG